MASELLYGIKLYQILVGVIGILIICVELGYRSGVRSRNQGQVDEPSESLLELIPTSLLGLLALLLGFTFSMAVSHFDARKKIMVEEANSIETSYLRTSLLLPEDVGPAREALKRYLDQRILFDGNVTQGRIAYNALTKNLQAEIWAIASKNSAARRDVSSSLFTSSVNQMIDISSEREFAADDHVPEIVYFIIFAMMMSCIYLLAAIYGRRDRGRLAPVFLAGLIGLVLVLIQDIDRPTGGSIRVKATLLLDLKGQLTR